MSGLRIPPAFALVAWIVVTQAASPPTVCAATNPTAAFEARFLQLCDLAGAEVIRADRKDPFFIGSYAVRALCVAYDVTGQKSYLDACTTWSDRMVTFQAQMNPRGAYYMNYGRKPGEDKGGWYVADSSSIAMGILATAARCCGEQRERYLGSVQTFAALVMDNYIGPGGGIRNGLWPKFDGEWWCCSGIFGSLAFLLHQETGEAKYLKAAMDTVNWLNQLDLPKDQPYPLADMGPTMLMYVLEAYSAGLPRVLTDARTRSGARAKLDWAFAWIAEQQQQPPLERKWPCDRGWGMKFGGLPFHQYVAARRLPERGKLAPQADAEIRELEKVLFATEPKFTQLASFLLMSYAERCRPGAIYQSSHDLHHRKQFRSPKDWR